MSLVDRYGPELEYDLHGRGVDLLDFIRGVHPWGKLLRLAGQLPASSRYQAALADDDDAVREYLSVVGEDHDERVRSGEIPRRPRTMAGWSEELAGIADMVDAVNQLHATLSQVNSKSGTRPKVARYPRPVLAVDRARRERDLTVVASVRNMFGPKEG